MKIPAWLAINLNMKVLMLDFDLVAPHIWKYIILIFRLHYDIYTLLFFQLLLSWNSSIRTQTFFWVFCWKIFWVHCSPELSLKCSNLSTRSTTFSLMPYTEQLDASKPRFMSLVSSLKERLKWLKMVENGWKWLKMAKMYLRLSRCKYFGGMVILTWTDDEWCCRYWY